MQEMFENEEMKRKMKTQHVIQTVTIAYLMHFEEEIATEGKLNQVLRNLLMNTHQNYLIFCELLVQLGPEFAQKSVMLS